MKIDKVKLKIVDTTDSKYKGFVFDSVDNPIKFNDGVVFYYDKTIQLPDGWRFVSSSYIIDTVELK